MDLWEEAVVHLDGLGLKVAWNGSADRQREADCLGQQLAQRKLWSPVVVGH